MTYNIFFSSSNKRIYRLMKEFYPYHLLLKDTTTLVPHYISHESPLYDEKNSIKLDHCLSNGKYCTSPRYDLGVTNGKDILLEDIRQKCIYLITYKTDSTAYWRYMSSFYNQCILGANPRFNVDCSYEILDQVGIEQAKLKECIYKSFDATEDHEIMYNNQNKLLEDDYEVKKKWKVKMFPTVLVNNKTLHGAWSAQNLFEAICAGYSSKPKACELYFTPQSEEENSNDFSFGSILMIIFVVIMLNVVIIYICKKYVMRKIHERIENVDINGRINNVVSSYLALRDTR